MSNIAEILLEIYSVTIPIIMGYIAWHLKVSRKEKKADNKGTMLLLRVQLIEYHEKWMKRGYNTRHGYTNFVEMYEVYHELGGNGMVEQLYQEIKELPIRGGNITEVQND